MSETLLPTQPPRSDELAPSGLGRRSSDALEQASPGPEGEEAARQRERERRRIIDRSNGRRGPLGLLKNLPIRSKLIITSVLAAALAVVLTVLGFVTYEVMGARERTVRQVTGVGRMMAWNAKTAFSLGDREAARVILSTLREDPRIQHACLVTDAGELFTSYVRAEAAADCNAVSLVNEEWITTDNDVIWSTPIHFQDRLLGALAIRAQALDWNEVARRYVGIGGAVMALSLVVAFFATSRMQRVISGPLQQLADAAGYVSRNRDYSVRVQDDARDELGALVTAFNEMLRQIKLRDGEMLKQRDRLLREVQARTAELVRREKAEERIRYLAYYDQLTDLPNRQALKERLELSLKEAARFKDQVAVLFLDLDRFKEINDNLGHSEGDRLLRQVAERLVHCVRSCDCVAHLRGGTGYAVSRQGGDEFTVLLTHLRAPEDASTVAQRIIEDLAKPVQLSDREVTIGASIGIAVYPKHGDSAETLLKHADMAMYDAKQNGTGRYSFFSDSIQDAALRKMNLESDLRRAMEWNEFKLHYQPKIDVQSGRISGVEALLRWVHPERGYISPAEFIPLAEELGLIATLGEWVLDRACEQARTWRDAGLPQVRVAVNVSGHQFAGANLSAVVADTLSAYELSPDCLELEITETAMLQNPDEAVETLEELRGIGVNIALDDFGTGFSSLNYVSRLPLDSLKIDSSFVQDLTRSEDARTIVTAVVAMAQSLRLTVVAEGVETVEQARLLRHLGVEELQGYLFSRPLPPAEVGPMLWGEADMRVFDGAMIPGRLLDAEAEPA